VLKCSEHARDAFRGCSEPCRHVRGHERAVGARVPADKLFERASDRIGERHWEAHRKGAPERIAIAGGVLCCREPHLAADADLDRPLLFDQPLHPLPPIAVARHVSNGAQRQVTKLFRIVGTAQIDLGCREFPDLAKDIVELVGRPGMAVLGHTLKLKFDIGQDVRVEQVAQLLGTQQVP